MIEINLESMQFCEVKPVGRSRVLLKMIDRNGASIEIITSTEWGEALHDALEKVCVNEAYWYSNMEKQIEELEIRVEELEDQVDTDVDSPFGRYQRWM